LAPEPSSTDTDVTSTRESAGVAQTTSSTGRKRRAKCCLSTWAYIYAAGGRQLWLFGWKAWASRSHIQWSRPPFISFKLWTCQRCERPMLFAVLLLWLTWYCATGRLRPQRRPTDNSVPHHVTGWGPRSIKAFVACLETTWAWATWM